jgi:hypothetical protein
MCHGSCKAAVGQLNSGWRDGDWQQVGKRHQCSAVRGYWR